jgi:glycosyltransferase involved in cell wall biosynthesis
VTKVCFISPEYWPLTGGTGSYVYYLSNELLKNRYKVYVVTGGNQAQDLKVNPQLDVSFLRIPKTPIVKSFMLAGNSYRKLQSVRKVADVDVMHPQLPLTPNFAVPPNFGKTLVCTVHSTWKGEAEAIRYEPYLRLNANEKFLVSFNWFLRFFEEGMLHRARKIIAVSHFTKWELVNYYKIPAHKIKVIHNGVDIKKFQPAADKRKIKTELGFNPS